jgi:hypothetical protein
MLHFSDWLIAAAVVGCVAIAQRSRDSVRGAETPAVASDLAKACSPP